MNMTRTVARVAAVLFLCIVSGCNKSRECTPDLIDDCFYIMVYDPFVVATGTRTAPGEAACHSIYEYMMVLTIDAVHLAYLPSKLVHAFHELLFP